MTILLKVHISIRSGKLSEDINLPIYIYMECTTMTRSCAKPSYLDMHLA